MGKAALKTDLIGNVFEHRNGKQKAKVIDFLGKDKKYNNIYKIECVECGEIRDNVQASKLKYGTFKLCNTCKEKEALVKKESSDKKNNTSDRNNNIPIAIEESFQFFNDEEPTIYSTAKNIDILRSELKADEQALEKLISTITIKKEDLQKHVDFLRIELGDLLFPKDEEKEVIEEDVSEDDISENILLFNKYETREGLKEYEGKRAFFTMTFEAFGISKKHSNKRTVLFLDIRDEGGKQVCEHHWFVAGAPFEKLNLQKGDIVELSAEIGKYDFNCYQNNKVTSGVKYQLVCLTHIRKLN